MCFLVLYRSALNCLQSCLTLFRIAALSGCCFTLPCICVDANELQQLWSPRDSGVVAGSHGGNCGQGVPQGMQEHPNTLASKQRDDGDEPGFGSALACPLCKRSLSLNQCYASGLYTNGFIFHPWQSLRCWSSGYSHPESFHSCSLGCGRTSS